jgi:hypothetical protein
MDGTKVPPPNQLRLKQAPFGYDSCYSTIMPGTNREYLIIRHHVLALTAAVGHPVPVLAGSAFILLHAK